MGHFLNPHLEKFLRIFRAMGAVLLIAVLAKLSALETQWSTETLSTISLAHLDINFDKSLFICAYASAHYKSDYRMHPLLKLKLLFYEVQ